MSDENKGDTVSVSSSVPLTMIRNGIPVTIGEGRVVEKNGDLYFEGNLRGNVGNELADYMQHSLVSGISLTAYSETSWPEKEKTDD